VILKNKKYRETKIVSSIFRSLSPAAREETFGAALRSDGVLN
jgi:hypothetical protein